MAFCWQMIIFILAFSWLTSDGRIIQRRAAVETSESSVRQKLVDLHNAKRRVIPSTSMLKMSWDKEAQKLAQDWAQQCQWRHPQGDIENKRYMRTSKFGCGQNIAKANYEMTWEHVMDMWYNEVKVFRFAGNNKGKMVGHYTAIVWNSTYLIGCGFNKCHRGKPNEFYFYVCDYCPAGNIAPHGSLPYGPGRACAKCPSNCDKGLCTNPCPVTNEYANCEQQSGTFKALFPKGCSNSPAYLDGMKKHCRATCECKDKKLYRL